MNEELQLEVGTEEAEKIGPMVVIIKDVIIEEVGPKKNKKVVLSCLHPAVNKLVHISSVKYEESGKLKTVGLWVNKDSKGKLQKNSGLARLIAHKNCKTAIDLKEMPVETALDDTGYLVIKIY